jgi:hypothetical protein
MFSGGFNRVFSRMNSGHRIVGLVLAAALAAVAVPADGPPAGAAPIRAFCGRYQHVTVTTRAGTAFVVRNDFWGTRRVCLQNSGLRPNFRVTRTRRNAIHGKVMSFPYILRGCSWGVCSPKSRLPARVRSLRKPEASWRVFARARGRWNASLETWFGKRDMKTGQANGAELMIWLNRHGPVHPAGPRVASDVGIGGRSYHVYLRQSRWNTITYLMTTATTSVRHLDLRPLVAYAVSRGYIQDSWYLIGVEAGFELWRGGAGLATDSFSVKVAGGGSP